ncbi:MAG: AraC family transcriptional regulator [Spirochaetia bacterium]|nr:AraC family transcriptional regulator [Spirochaetia bacterium]
MPQIGELYFASKNPIYYGKDITYASSGFPATTLSISLGNPFKILLSESPNHLISYRAHLIKCGVLRTSQSTEEKALTVYLTKSSNLTHFCEKFILKNNDWADISAYFRKSEIHKIKSSLERGMNCENIDAVHSLIEEFILESGLNNHSHNKKPIDPRILSVIHFLIDNVETGDGKVDFSRISELSDISLSRLQHLFKEETGKSIQRFYIALRTLKFFKIISGVSTLTEAAHLCGFTDSSHMNHVFMKLYGIKPSIYFPGKGRNYIQVQFLSKNPFDAVLPSEMIFVNQ